MRALIIVAISMFIFIHTLNIAKEAVDNYKQNMSEVHQRIDL